MQELINLLSDLPTRLDEERTETLFESGSMRVERIVSLGHCSPDGFWYDQEQSEWVLLLAGAARLLLEGDSRAIELKPGDSLHLPPRRRHRVEWTDPAQPTVWLAIYY